MEDVKEELINEDVIVEEELINEDEIVEEELINADEIVEEDRDIESELMNITSEELVVKLDDGIKICDAYKKQIEDEKKTNRKLKCSSVKACVLRGGCPGSFVHNQDLLYYLKLIYQFIDRSVDVSLKQRLCTIMDDMMENVNDHPVFNFMKHERVSQMLTIINNSQKDAI